MTRRLKKLPCGGDHLRLVNRGLELGVGEGVHQVDNDYHRALAETHPAGEPARTNRYRQLIERAGGERDDLVFAQDV